MRWMVIALAVALGCGGAEQKGHRKSDEQQVDPARAEQHIKQSEAKKKQNAFAEARELLREAYRYSDPEIRHRIGLAHEELDEAQATYVAARVDALAKGGKCAEAIAEGARVVEKTADTSVPGLLAQKSGEGVAKCVAGVIGAGELVRARQLMTA
ncbi:MAG TPA: hypothetical protein VFB62_11255, partial [Polyangiaceae bacterium]|nr:hypothetical protein [Polyangiaceae bacterium]